MTDDEIERLVEDLLDASAFRHCVNRTAEGTRGRLEDSQDALVAAIKRLRDERDAAFERAVANADTERTAGPCTVRKVADAEWELWCENPGTGWRPVPYRLASFGTPAECRAVCNALNRVAARALAARDGAMARLRSRHFAARKDGPDA